MRVVRAGGIPRAQILKRLKSKTKIVLIDFAERTKTTTAKGILRGAILGAGHIASQPFEYPNADTGALHTSFEVNFQPGSLKVTVGSPLAYGRDLEFGNSRMKPRPHLSPSFYKELPETRRNFRRLRP